MPPNLQRYYGRLIAAQPHYGRLIAAQPPRYYGRLTAAQPLRRAGFPDDRQSSNLLRQKEQLPRPYPHLETNIVLGATAPFSDENQLPRPNGVCLIKGRRKRKQVRTPAEKHPASPCEQVRRKKEVGCCVRCRKRTQVRTRPSYDQPAPPCRW